MREDDLAAEAAERNYGRAQSLAPADSRPPLLAGLGTLERTGKLREARQAFAKILGLPVGEEAKSYARQRIAEIDARTGGRR